MRTMKHLMLAAVTATALALAGCGGGGSSSMAPPPPTPYETAKAAIAAAATAEAAQAAYDAVKDDVTASEGEKLQMAVNERTAMLATAARIMEQKQALMTAAGMIDTSDLSTQELVDAANAAIRGLRQALEDAADVSDADKAMYMSQLDDAVAAVDTAQGGIDTATRRTNQMAALSSASTALQSALAALSGSTPTQAQLDAANNARTALNTAIADGADLTDDEKATYVREAANAAAPIQMAQAAFDDAKDKADDDANKAMAATAKKLYNGLAIPETPHGVTIATTGAVTVDPSGDTLTEQALTEDKKTAVAANHGWMGKRHTASGTGVTGTYEAIVYANVGDPTEGKKFGSATDNDDYEYTLNAQTNTELTIDTSQTGVAGRVASSSFDQSAGKKEFKLPDNTTRVMISGSYHGVSGTYYCAPASGETCSASVAESGFTLANGTWTFKASNNEARVMSVADNVYVLYGWWLHKAANDGDYTASAFHAERGEVPAATGLDTLNGTATYMGGAAGKYALRSSTGGTNDAGHFTARATLNADFSDNSITGTIDNFMGVGGAKNWSVELKEAALAADGTIARVAEDDTVWTIGGTAAAASGAWLGSLQDNGTDGVPKVGSGTFNSTFNDDGRMVGAFGVNKQ